MPLWQSSAQDNFRSTHLKQNIPQPSSSPSGTRKVKRAESSPIFDLPAQRAGDFQKVNEVTQPRHPGSPYLYSSKYFGVAHGQLGILTTRKELPHKWTEVERTYLPHPPHLKLDSEEVRAISPYRPDANCVEQNFCPDDSPSVNRKDGESTTKNPASTLVDGVENALGNEWINGGRAHGRFLRSSQRPESWSRDSNSTRSPVCQPRRAKSRVEYADVATRTESPSSPSSMLPGFGGSKLRHCGKTQKKQKQRPHTSPSRGSRLSGRISPRSPRSIA
ncbi:hypothetical protein BSKO_00899 [Bryopsis sp. KO-2023]|nr:hypothetical protein BSKO_00899 [Bryopsis sp. KO-2023]